MIDAKKCKPKNCFFADGEGCGGNCGPGGSECDGDCDGGGK